MSEDTTAAEAGGAEAAPDVDPKIEERARKDGWVPQDEWRGKPEDWRDADAFVKRGEEIQARVDARIGPELRAMKRENAELKQTIDEFKDWMPKAEQRMYERARKDIEAKMDAAVAVGDVDGYNAAKADMAGLDKEVQEAGKREPAKPNGQQMPREVTDWQAANEWFDRDPKMRAWATAKHGELLVDKPGLTLAENLAEVTRLAKARFPDEFGIEPPRKAPDVEPGGGRPRGNGNARTYENLPADAKAACARQIKHGLVKDRAEYVKYYYEDE